MSFLQFGVFYSLLFIANSILESAASTLLAKIVPNNIGMNTGMIIIITTTIGKFVGSCIVSIFGKYFGIDYLDNSIFLFFSILFATILLVVYIKFKDLRVKAISRIIKKQN